MISLTWNLIDQTELTSKIETDSERAGRQLRGREGGDGGIKQKGKRTHGHGQQCDDCEGGREFKDSLKGLNLMEK